MQILKHKMLSGCELLLFISFFSLLKWPGSKGTFYSTSRDLIKLLVLMKLKKLEVRNKIFQEYETGIKTMFKMLFSFLQIYVYFPLFFRLVTWAWKFS